MPDDIKNLQIVIESSVDDQTIKPQDLGYINELLSILITNTENNLETIPSINDVEGRILYNNLQDLSAAIKKIIILSDEEKTQIELLKSNILSIKTLIVDSQEYKSALIKANKLNQKREIAKKETLQRTKLNFVKFLLRLGFIHQAGKAQEIDKIQYNDIVTNIPDLQLFCTRKNLGIFDKIEDKETLILIMAELLKESEKRNSEEIHISIHQLTGSPENDKLKAEKILSNQNYIKFSHGIFSKDAYYTTAKYILEHIGEFNKYFIQLSADGVLNQDFNFSDPNEIIGTVYYKKIGKNPERTNSICIVLKVQISNPHGNAIIQNVHLVTAYPIIY